MGAPPAGRRGIGSRAEIDELEPIRVDFIELMFVLIRLKKFNLRLTIIFNKFLGDGVGGSASGRPNPRRGAVYRVRDLLSGRRWITMRPVDRGGCGCVVQRGSSERWC